VDGIERARFDPRETTSVQLHIGPETEVIEVRGEDAQGELALATLLVRWPELPRRGPLTDWIVLEGGQKVTIQLTPSRDEHGDLESARVEVSFAETQPIRAISLWAQQAWLGLTEWRRRSRDVSPGLRPGYSWLAKAAAAVAAVGIIAFAFILYQQQRTQIELPTPPRAALPTVPQIEPVSPRSPALPPVPPPSGQEPNQLIARATWNMAPDAALGAIRIEGTRSEATAVDLSLTQVTLLISLPVEDDRGQTYSRYRVTLVSAQKPVWTQTLRAPQASPGKRRHILSVVLFPQRLPREGSSAAQVEGQTRSGWQSLGQVPLDLMNR
jgi:hypothetical protein